MRPSRTLTLRKEALAELTSDELSLVAAGQDTIYCPASAVQCATRVVWLISTALNPCPLL